ncbi:sporulation protein Cse60 [Ligilactobacillus sp. 110_WCHN]|uniref:sporulation protein Cse60 n=1 Tax=Ligilactobacillus sp. 110_WCHN TaxID=3057125 RepID=UPI002670D7A7|nr:sporulation protein Cse60 [Ligilactobacillus sp. 110_WCHN]MDO3393399.1 sporulation protein Cse60 [Ligilactobacillus sp. 110_WCHN]
MIQVKEFSNTLRYDSTNQEWHGRSLEKAINEFLKNNPDIKLIDIKYSQATDGYSEDIYSTSCALVIYEK